MYINGLFLLLIWCVGWADINFATGVSLITILLVISVNSTHLRRRCLWGLVILIMALLGQYYHTNSHWPKQWEGKDLRLTACVNDLQYSATGLSVVIDDVELVQPHINLQKTDINLKGVSNVGIKGRIKLSVFPYNRQAQPVLAGDHVTVFDVKHHPPAVLSGLIGREIQLLIRARHPRNYANPESFDYVRWSQLERQVATGYVKHWLVTGGRCQTPVWSLLASHVKRLRFDLWQRIQGLPISSLSQQLWGALILGQTKALSGVQWQVLSATGTTHLFVISGLHVGLVAVLVMSLVRLGLMPFAVSSTLGIRVGAWLGIIASIVFAVLAGFGLPAQRAVIMLMGLLWGRLWGLGLGFTQRLFVAFMVTLVLQPSSVVSLGFWLSYAAVLALGLVWYSSSVHFWWYKLFRLIAAQGALTLILWPIIGLATGTVSLVGPLLNLALVPLFSLLVIPLMMVFSLLLLIVDLPDIVFNTIDKGFVHLWGALERVAHSPLAQIHVDTVPTGLWIGGLLVGMLCMLVRSWLIGLWVIWLLLVMLWVLTPRPVNSVSVTVFDVGQGLSVWFEAINDGNKEQLIYDVGNQYRSGFNMVNAVILPELRANGVTHIDTLVIGHWDSDHSGGLTTLISQLRVSNLVLPSQVNPNREVGLADYTNNANVTRCRTTRWQGFGGSYVSKGSGPVRWRMLALGGVNNYVVPALKGNNASCVLIFEIYGRRVVVAGDIEAKAEKLLTVLEPEVWFSDVLISPHHGSKTSSTNHFLNYVRPGHIIISAGANNSYGHPHKSVVEAYWQHGGMWYNTARDGQVQVVFRPKADYVITTNKP